MRCFIWQGWSRAKSDLMRIRAFYCRIIAQALHWQISFCLRALLFSDVRNIFRKKRNLATTSSCRVVLPRFLRIRNYSTGCFSTTDIFNNLSQHVADAVGVASFVSYLTHIAFTPCQQQDVWTSCLDRRDNCDVWSSLSLSWSSFLRLVLHSFSIFLYVALQFDFQIPPCNVPEALLKTNINIYVDVPLYLTGNWRVFKCFATWLSQICWGVGFLFFAECDCPIDLKWNMHNEDFVHKWIFYEGYSSIDHIIFSRISQE